jgi:hypothetical protein
MQTEISPVLAFPRLNLMSQSTPQIYTQKRKARQDNLPRFGLIGTG